MVRKEYPKSHFDGIVTWIGSPQSLVVHTIVFATAFLLAAFQVVEFEIMLLVLTTAVSLEAIYLAIFIQMSVNRNTASLREVEEDIDEIEEELEEMGEDDKKEIALERLQNANIEKLTEDVRRVLATLETLKK